jgi:acyl-CoA thioester hydrolase
MPTIPASSISRTTLRVRYAETDQMGVVYYANYFIWFEIGRVELLRGLGFSYKEMELEEDCFIPVVDTSCRYKAPARYDEELELETRILHLRPSVLKFGYRLLRPNAGEAPTLLAEGESVHVLTDRTMQKRTLPEKYAAAIRASLDGFPNLDSHVHSK